MNANCTLRIAMSKSEVHVVYTSMLFLGSRFAHHIKRNNCALWLRIECTVVVDFSSYLTVNLSICSKAL